MNNENKRLSKEARATQKRERSNKLDDLVLRSVVGTRMQVFVEKNLTVFLLNHMIANIL